MYEFPTSQMVCVFGENNKEIEKQLFAVLRDQWTRVIKTKNGHMKYQR